MSRNIKLFKRLDELEAEFERRLAAAINSGHNAWKVFLTTEAAEQYGFPEWYSDGNKPFRGLADDIVALRRKLNWDDSDCLAARFLTASAEAHDLTDHHRVGAEKIAQQLFRDSPSEHS